MNSHWFFAIGAGYVWWLSYRHGRKIIKKISKTFEQLHPKSFLISVNFTCCPDDKTLRDWVNGLLLLYQLTLEKICVIRNQCPSRWREDKMVAENRAQLIHFQGRDFHRDWHIYFVRVRYVCMMCKKWNSVESQRVCERAKTRTDKKQQVQNKKLVPSHAPPYYPYILLLATFILGYPNALF